jgi:hypothetical protein
MLMVLPLSCVAWLSAPSASRRVENVTTLAHADKKKTSERAFFRVV